MYSPEDIQARLREKPFRPFRIIASEGLQYEIRHPDLVFVGMNNLQIGSPWPDHPGIYSRVTRVAILHVVAMEDLPVPAISGNGQSQ